MAAKELVDIVAGGNDEDLEDRKTVCIRQRELNHRYQSALRAGKV